jgi:sulfatase modifying factor 1
MPLQRLLPLLAYAALGCSSVSTQADANDSGLDAQGASAADGNCTVGSVATGVSCAEGGAMCGPCSQSCCSSPRVPGGTFYRTYTGSDAGPSGESHLASVSGFHLDEYEVTVGRFRQFVSAWDGGAGWTPPQGSGRHVELNGGLGLNAVGGGYESGWNTMDNINIAPTDAHLMCYSGTWTASVGTSENTPINCVNWYEAYAFCIWDGGFLPSEAEWEYAASGGSEQREYPWGSTDPGATSEYEIYDCKYPSGAGPCTGAGNLSPVGTAARGAGLWGQLDLAGNVEEWGLDWYEVPYLDPCTDCAYLNATTRRVLRGGNFSEFASTTLSSYRDASPPTSRSGFYGMRCARQ